MWSLSTSLCRVVTETVYDINQVVLPSSYFEKEARKHVLHVVTSILPNDQSVQSMQSMQYGNYSVGTKRSRLSDMLNSPFNRSELYTPDTSLIGTPSSVTTVNSTSGMDVKRTRLMPSLPQPPLSSDQYSSFLFE